MALLESPALIDILASYFTSSSLISFTSTCKQLLQHPMVSREARRRFPLYFQIYDIAISVWQEEEGGWEEEEEGSGGDGNEEGKEEISTLPSNI